MTEDLIQGKPEKRNWRKMFEDYTAPVISRDQIELWSGGLVRARTLANKDSLGIGIRGKFRCGRRIGYPIENVIEYLEAQTDWMDEEPEEPQEPLQH